MSNPVSLFAPAGGGKDPLARLRSQAEELEGVFLNTLMKTADTLEGIASFEEKRKPVWKNT